MSIIGIDLGTTNSLVSVWKDGKATIIPNSLGNNFTPSIVSIDEDNSILVGEVAKERLITHPNLTVSNFKRFMGTDKEFNLGSHVLSATDLSSLILKSLKRDAESFLGEEVTEAVISVPAYFNDSQRKATKIAGELAGLKVERLISEPTAAAISYGMHKAENDTQFLIFDLGGGTFDVSILELFDNVMEVKSIAGDNYLGGEDFNNLLISYFLEKNDLYLESLNDKNISTLHKEAESCKRSISKYSKGNMKLNIDSSNYELTIDSDTFEKICNELLLKLKTPIYRAMRDADISTDELDAVILIGGSTKMPLIRSTVSRIFKTLPFSNINPDEAVAIGAAIQAGLKERNEDLKEMILTDVCPYSLGVAIGKKQNNSYIGDIFSPIIERNSPIPISKSEIYTTIHDYQKEIIIDIYQGERMNVNENIKLGTMSINIPPKLAGEELVDIRFTYDINGLLEVEATSIETGVRKSILIEKSPGSMSKEEIAERLKELEKLKIHPKDELENRLIIARGERLYEESLGEKRNFIENLLINFQYTLNTQNLKQISIERKKLTDIFNELECEI